MSSVAEHQASVATLLAGLRDRRPERWSGTTPPTGPVPRVLGEDLVTTIDLPPFDNSQMDGYAVRSAEVAAGVSFRVGDRIAAGSGIEELLSGQAAPIMTGAPIPDGADAVIPIEASLPDEFQPEHSGATVEFGAAVAAGTYVRPRGSDLAAGSVLLAAGTRLGASQWGVIASAGITTVPLVPRVRVLVLSTGDELQRAGHTLHGGRIYDANGASMAAAVAEAGGVVTETLVVRDDARLLRAVFEDRDRHEGVDLVLTTGGVSKGAYEVVRDVFEGAGVRVGSVAMQPGGPQGLGVATLDGFSAPVVAFPGNPVSALVSFEIFLRPVLRALHGLPPNRRVEWLPLASAIESPETKHQVRRGRTNPAGEIELVGGPSSHLLHSYAASTHLVHVPVGVSALAAGDLVETWNIEGES